MTRDRNTAVIHSLKVRVANQMMAEEVRLAVLYSTIQVFKWNGIDTSDETIKKLKKGIKAMTLKVLPKEKEKYQDLVRVYFEYGIEEDDDLWEEIEKLASKVLGTRIARDYINDSVMYFAYNL